MSLDRTIKGIILNSGKQINFDNPINIQIVFKFDTYHWYDLSKDATETLDEQSFENWKEGFKREEVAYLLVETAKGELYEFKEKEIAAFIRDAAQYHAEIERFNKAPNSEEEEKEEQEEITI